MNSILKKYVGDRAFYKSAIAIAVPIMIQNGITNLVNLLDNVMVGTLGTEAMSGVSIVNQFIFIFNLLIFGAISAAGIFTAQYYGHGDTEGVRSTFQIKLIINLAAGILGVLAFLTFDEQLINLFLHTSENTGNLALTLKYGKKYLSVMIIGLIPYAISQAYASTMRETSETVIPMVAGVIAVATNCTLNVILIFGYLGAPALGVTGAAIATVVSRFAELLFLVIYAHTHKAKLAYVKGTYTTFKISKKLCTGIALKGIPLMLNEFFWAMAMTMRNQCYSTRGLDAVAAQNISSTIFNLFNVVYMSMGCAVAIIIGKLLGAGELEEAKDADRKLIVFSVFCGFVVGSLLALSSLFFPKIYNTTDSVRALASYFMVVSAATMPFCAFANSSYYTLRSGGQVLITILFDSVYMWGVVMPVSICLAYLTEINIKILFAICQGVEAIKFVFGLVLLKKGSWVKTLVANEESPSVKDNISEKETQSV